MLVHRRFIICHMLVTSWSLHFALWLSSVWFYLVHMNWWPWVWPVLLGVIACTRKETILTGKTNQQLLMWLQGHRLLYWSTVVLKLLPCTKNIQPPMMHWSIHNNKYKEFFSNFTANRDQSYKKEEKIMVTYACRYSSGHLIPKPIILTWLNYRD